MPSFNLRSILAKFALGPSNAKKFAQVLVHLRLEYKLSSEIWDAAEDVQHALIASERSEARRGRESSWQRPGLRAFRSSQTVFLND